MPGAVIALPRVIRIGAGALDEVAAVLSGLRLARPFIVTDRFLASQPAAERLSTGLAVAGMRAGLAPYFSYLHKKSYS